MCLLAICGSSVGKHLLRFSAHLKNWVVCFFIAFYEFGQRLFRCHANGIMRESVDSFPKIENWSVKEHASENENDKPQTRRKYLQKTYFIMNLFKIHQELLEHLIRGNFIEKQAGI